MLNNINNLHGGELVKDFDNVAIMKVMQFVEKVW
jgi:acyl-CoA hydrolase